MKKISTILLVLGSVVLFSQQLLWQKNIESGTQDFGSVPNKLVNENSIDYQYYFLEDKIEK